MKTGRTAIPLLRRVARHVAAAEGFRAGRLSVAVVGDRKMAALHRRFMDIAGTTDVLTFDLGTNARRGVLDGEIVLCADVARRCAARHRRAAKDSRIQGFEDSRGKKAAPLSPSHVPTFPRSHPSARAELALYLTHGILHLAGYDDHAPAAFRKMHRREDQLLTALGLGAVFRSARD